MDEREISRASFEAALMDAWHASLVTYKRSLDENRSTAESKELAEQQKAAKLTLSHLDLIWRLSAKIIGRDTIIEGDSEPLLLEQAVKIVDAFDADNIDHDS